jgi:hypothetical protein
MIRREFFKVLGAGLAFPFFVNSSFAKTVDNKLPGIVRTIEHALGYAELKKVNPTLISISEKDLEEYRWATHGWGYPRVYSPIGFRDARSQKDLPIHTSKYHRDNVVLVFGSLPDGAMKNIMVKRDVGDSIRWLTR